MIGITLLFLFGVLPAAVVDLRGGRERATMTFEKGN